MYESTTAYDILFISPLFSSLLPHENDSFCSLRSDFLLIFYHKIFFLDSFNNPWAVMDP